MLPPAPLVIFIIVVITVVLSVLKQDEIVTIPVLKIKHQIKFYHPPLIGVGLLLLLSPTSGSLNGKDIWIGGFAGEGKVFPYHTMVQFETLAFVCIALDMTGVLAYIALKAIQAAGSSGRKLYFYFYFLSSAFTICTSNDIVILTLTPIIYYCTKVAKISPYPMLFSEFFTANICSMVLVIGNPVNLIVANANGLGFAQYSNWMAAPAIVGSFVCCMLMYFFYRKDIDVTFTPPNLDPDACLKDKRGIVFHGAVLFLTRLFLGVGDTIHAEGWIITSVAAVFSLVYNLVFWPWELPSAISEADLLTKLDKRETTRVVELQPYSPTETPEKCSPYSKELSSPTASSSLMEKDFIVPQSPAVEVQNIEVSTPSGEKINFVITADDVTKKESEAVQKLQEQQGLQFRDPDEIHVEIPTAKAAILNCPWAVLPFVFGMFTLVNGLKNAGWIDAFAHAILDVIPGDEGNSARAIAISTFLMTTISFVLCTLIDNQPASILLTQVLLAPSFDSLPSRVRTAGMLGVLEGANVGGCWSLMGALAGIMWSTLLRNKGITIGYIQFMRVGLKVMPFVTFIVALIIFAEASTK